MCCTWLAENTGRKNNAKNRHLGTNAQLCRAISSQLRHVSTIGKKLVKAIFPYAIWFEPASNHLRTSSEPAPNQLRTSSEPTPNQPRTSWRNGIWLLSSNISSTCFHNMVNFGLLAAEIGRPVWGTPANFKWFRILAALLHGI